MNETKTILISGYEPFGGDEYNPSLELAKALSGRSYEGYVFRDVSVPVSYRNCVAEMIKAIEFYRPEIIIATGLAWGRSALSVERVAINVTDFPIPDNEGYVSLNEVIDPKGATAYFATLPIRAMVKEVRDVGVPAYISNTAGTFCCNMLMYGTLNYIAKNNLKTKAGMIHIPFTPALVAKKHDDIPSMSFEVMLKGVEAAAKAAIDYEKDIELICGAVN